MLKKLFLAFALLLVALPSSAQQFVQPVGGTTRGAAPSHYLSAVSNNSTLVAAGHHTVYEVVAINTTATIYYLKLYDKATAPTCGTDTPTTTLPVPVGQSSSGGGFAIPLPVGSEHLQGIGFCLVGGIADNDNSNAATGVAINLWIR